MPTKEPKHGGIWDKMSRVAEKIDAERQAQTFLQELEDEKLAWQESRGKLTDGGQHADIVFSSSRHPGHRDGRPYHLDTIERDGRYPRRRWYATYNDLVKALGKANPGKRLRATLSSKR